MTAEFLNLALLYLYRKATAEVKEFAPEKIIRKQTVEKDGIVLSKNRLVDCLDYVYTGELNIDLGPLGIKAKVP